MLGADASGESCQEKKVLYKLISGLHSSISIHIASDYLLDEAKSLVCSSSVIFLCQIFFPFFLLVMWINLTLLKATVTQGLTVESLALID